MKKIAAISVLAFMIACNGKKVETSLPTQTVIATDSLKDKIMGGWAGQVIGCTYGGPTEFHYKGSMINDYTPIKWDPHCIKWWYDNSPGLYDDVYMDLTFVDVFEKLGLDAPADSHAMAFAKAEYMLWHANQSARYNILNGIMPPASGYWKNNPHADDIDYQIEADFAGLMCPGMPNSASAVSDKVGHIMNYGDGWYGGVYVGAMYSLAFVSKDVEFIVTEALKTIPQQSIFYQCINDVIVEYRKNPNDWKDAWFVVQKKWADDRGCPDGVFNDFNIDASVNAAYIVIGLLYGHGDFDKTMEIATRCGQDSDCNPASAAGILGTMHGYSHIPAKYMDNLKEVEDMDFKYTTISLNDVYKMSLGHALKMIEKNGGKNENGQITIAVQSPEPVKFEKCFEGIEPVDMISTGWGGFWLKKDKSFDTTFTGAGIVVKGYSKTDTKKLAEYTSLAEVSVDGKIMDTVSMPSGYHARNNDIYWNYDLQEGKHTLSVKWINPKDGADLSVSGCLIYQKE